MSAIVYLGAVGRSGTTLLERAAATSPSFVSLGEMVHLWERGVIGGEPCGCGLPLRECPFWSAVADRAFGGWDALDGEEVRSWQRLVDRNRYIPMLLWPRLGGASFRDALASFTSLLDRLYAAIGDVAGPRTVLVDASKHPSYFFVLRRLRGHDVRLLHVVRDPRGVAHSWSSTVKRPESAVGEDMERLGTWHAIARWTSHNLIFSLVGRRGRHAMLRYERFAADPNELGSVLDRLTTDLGTDAPHFDDHLVQLRTNHTVSGNPMRFTTGPLTIRPDDRWRSSMARAPRLIVSVLTAPLRLGYRL
ncbi:MAG: sulfotransferase [Ilumatobacteraceae bacterium]